MVRMIKLKKYEYRKVIAITIAAKTAYGVTNTHVQNYHYIV